MPFLITQGLGSAADGTGSGMLVTQGLGGPGLPLTPTCLALEVLALESFGHYLIASFSKELVVSGPGLNPANYPITGPTNVVATAIELLAPGHLLKIHVTEQQTSATYNLTFPEQGIMSTTGNLLDGPFTMPFIGLGTPTTVQIAKSFDERTLDIVFSEAVMQVDAENPANYLVSPSLQVVAAKRVTDFNYRLTTSSQTINQLYTVTAINIRDVHGNL